MEQNQQPQPPVFNQPQIQPPAQPYQPRVTVSPMMDPITAVKTCFKKYFDFTGRARRSEFWWFMLFGFIISSGLSYLGMIMPFVGYVSWAFTLVMIIPVLAALSRRLHDTNRGTWWVVLMAILLVGYYGSAIALIGSNFTALASSTNVEDIMGMASEIVDAIQTSPMLATIMSACALGVLLLTLVLLIFTIIDSKWGENKYGPSPKYQ